MISFLRRQHFCSQKHSKLGALLGGVAEHYLQTNIQRFFANISHNLLFNITTIMTLSARTSFFGAPSEDLKNFYSEER